MLLYILFLLFMMWVGWMAMRDAIAAFSPEPSLAKEGSQEKDGYPNEQVTAAERGIKELPGSLQSAEFLSAGFSEEQATRRQGHPPQ